jgi:hypothetical protein
MFIKLNFTTNKSLSAIFRIVADIINTPSVTSVAELRNRATAASYYNDLLASFSDDNSTIIRTVNPSGVRAHVQRPSATAETLRVTFEFPVYDAPNTKYYVQYTNTSATSATGTPDYQFDIGTALSGGTMDSTQFSLSLPNSTASIEGTTLGLVNRFQSYTSTRTVASQNSYCFWMYITNEGMVWSSSTPATVNRSGWGESYNNSAYQQGPWIIGQYTRFDAFNKNSNGIIPVMYSTPRANGVGFLLSADLSVRNPAYLNDSASIPFRVVNIIEALPKVGTGWPVVYHPHVSHTIKGYSNATGGYAATQPGLVTTSSDTTQYGRKLTITANERYPAADFASTGFALIPLGWECTYRGNHGGNLTEQTGVYLFNGDYYPGDTFSLNGKTWMVWPAHMGYVNRLGLAVPME